MNKPLLGVIGSLPRPVGGVTAFLDRFVSKLIPPDFFLDYVSNSTKPIFCDERVEYFVARSFIGSALSFFRIEFERLLVKRAKIVWFINFSTPAGLLRCLLLAKLPGATWVLMLHNGELRHNGILQVLPSVFVRWLYRRFDKVLVISDKQQNYYSKYVSPERVVAVKSYLPALNYGRFSSLAVDRLLKIRSKRSCPIITLSGYPLKDYGYELFFEAVTPLLDRDFLVCICCYGDRADGVKQFVPPVCLDRVLFFFNLSEHGFTEVLRATDIYVRPNLVDSFGVAVADAVRMGKIVIASDVCERVPGTALFHSGEPEPLRELISSAFDGRLAPLDPRGFARFEEENVIKLNAVFSGGSY